MTAGVREALRTTYYALVHLSLANLAYASENDGKSVVSAVTAILADPNKLPPLPAPPDADNRGAAPLPIDGYWKLDWGGDIGDNTNGVLIMSFRDGARPAAGAPDGVPYFFAVSIRGTDTEAWKGAEIVEIFEDLDAFGQTPWAAVLGTLPNPSRRTIPPALTGKIANGTADGLRIISRFGAPLGGQPETLAGAMAALLAEYPATPVVITGHSLGACLTQVVAAYLAWQLYDTQSTPLVDMLPNPFAPPAAGDAAFAAMYDTLFPNGHFWFNETDLVPHAWTEVLNIPKLWVAQAWPAPAGGEPPAGPKCPFAFDAVVDLWGKKVPPYARPSVNQQALAAGLPTQDVITAFLQSSSSTSAWNSWSAQLLWQHMPPCYHTKISAAVPASQLAPFALVDTKPPY